ncbi:unnamed protein product, partial [Adineta steineri]
MNIQQKNTTVSSSQQSSVNNPRPLPPMITTDQQQQQREKSSKKKRRTTKRCHGNQKLRRFKKKCVKRGLNREEIQKRIDEYNCKKNANQVSNEGTEQMEVTTTTKNKETKRKSNKRKRMSTSISLRSITQPVPKKIKRKSVSTINPMSKQTNYQLPKYLKKSPNVLFQSLRLQLDQKLNTKVQQRFLHYRLQLIDQQHRLNLHQNLWQSYCTLGCEQQIWP